MTPRADYVSPQLALFAARALERPFHKRYARIYAMLKRTGHGPAKALEVIIDASRGNAYATQWIRMQRRMG